MENNEKILATSEIALTKQLCQKAYSCIYRKERIINILILFMTLFVFVSVCASGEITVFDCVFVLLLCSAFIFLFRKKDNKIKKNIDSLTEDNIISVVNFYDNYLEIIYKNNNTLNIVSNKCEYKNVNKVFENKDYIFIMIDNKFEIVNKRDINELCIKKLNSKSILNEEKYNIENKIKFIFYSQFLSIFVSLLIIMLSIIFFNIPGFPLGYLEYSWIFLIFVPVPVYFIVIVLKSRKLLNKYLKNILSGVLIILLFLTCGIISITQQYKISHSIYYLTQIEKKINMNFPSDGKVSVALEYRDDIKKVIMVKFNKEDKEELLDVVQSKNWRTSSHYSMYSNTVDASYYNLTSNYDYFCSYNITDKKFNSYGNGDTILYMAYNETSNTLFIVEYVMRGL